jgi:sugar O-acyltransferase (sialic acid O-acetyltransferase NeuD family)
MKKKFLVVGNSGFAKEVAQIIVKFYPDREFKGYVTNVSTDVGKQLPYGSIVCTDEELLNIDDEIDLAIGIAHPKARKALSEKFKCKKNFHFPNIIHPSVNLFPEVVQVGVGNIICENCIFTVDISIGDYNVFNWNVTVGHDATVASFCVVNPSSNISGNVHVGASVQVGVGAQILQGLSVGEGAIIGASSLITKSVPSNEVWYGVPAKFIRSTVNSTL